MGSRTLPAEGMGLTIQSVGKCVQDLIFGEKSWERVSADEARHQVLSDYVENRLVSLRVQLVLTGGSAAADGEAVVG